MDAVVQLHWSVSRSECLGGLSVAGFFIKTRPDEARWNQTSRPARSEGCASAIRLQMSNVSGLSGRLAQMISDDSRHD